MARSLLKKYEKKKRSEKYSQFIDCLGELAVEGEGDDVLTYTRKWFDLVNRGGLYPINDVAFTLFAKIEITVRDLLPKHILRSTSEQDSFKINVDDKVLKKEEIVFYWTLLSQDIDAPDDAEILNSDKGNHHLVGDYQRIFNGCILDGVIQDLRKEEYSEIHWIT